MRKPYLLLGFVLVLSLILHDLCNSKDNIHVQALLRIVVSSQKQLS